MPKIEAKNREWLNGSDGLQELAQSKPKHGPFTYRIRRLMRVVVQAAEDISIDREGILDEFTKKDGDGNPIMLADDQVALTNPPAYGKRMREFMNATTALDVEPLKAEELEKEKIIISPATAYKLGPLLLDPAVTDDGVAESAADPSSE